MLSIARGTRSFKQHVTTLLRSSRGASVLAMRRASTKRAKFAKAPSASSLNECTLLPHSHIEPRYAPTRSRPKSDLTIVAYAATSRHRKYDASRHGHLRRPRRADGCSRTLRQSAWNSAGATTTATARTTAAAAAAAARAVNRP